MTPHIIHVPRRFTANAWGGTEEVITRLASGLDENGYSGSIMTSMALDAQDAVTVHGLDIRRFPHYYPEWPLAAERRDAYDRKGGNLISPGLVKAVRQQQPLSLVHLHTGNRLGASCLRVARSRGVPCIITLHGGHFTIPPAELRSLVGDGPRKGLEWGRVLSWWLGTRRLLSDVDAIVCVGEEEAEAARRHLPGQRVCWIPGGVDVERFALGNAVRGHELLGHDPSQPLIVCLARLDAQKDQETLTTAWAGLSTACDLALIGAETTPGYANRCRLAAAGSRGRLLISGNLDATVIPDVLAAASLVVLPSRHEPFGLACLEAWAARRAIIAAAVGGPARLLADGTGGRLFPAGNVSDLRQALSHALERPELCARWGEEGHAKARRDFTWKSVVERYCALYADLGVKRGDSRR